MKRIVIYVFCCLITGVVFSQKMTSQEYIDTYKNLAVAEMYRAGVPAAITLAQGVLETESGNSELVKKSNNHFGIKCKAEWAGATVYHDDDENGECFRKYDSAIFSYRDHSDFLRTRAHYAFLFSLDPTDYKGWAYGLKQAGYATNPRYPEILIKTIEDYNLNNISENTLKQIPDYSIYQIIPTKSRIAVVDKSMKRINDFIEPEKIKTKSYNGLKAVYADSGVSLLAIATSYDIPLMNLLEYNDLITDGLLNKSTWIYLQRKRTEGIQATYQAKENESLLEISQKNAIQLSYLLAYNGLNENDIVKTGTVLILKSTAATKQTDDVTNVISSKIKKVKTKLEKNKKENDATEIVKTHRVRPNESLDKIAKKYKTSVSKLKEWNGLKSNHLKIGQQLIIAK